MIVVVGSHRCLPTVADLAKTAADSSTAGLTPAVSEAPPAAAEHPRGAALESAARTVALLPPGAPRRVDRAQPGTSPRRLALDAGELVQRQPADLWARRRPTPAETGAPGGSAPSRRTAGSTGAEVSAIAEQSALLGLQLPVRDHASPRAPVTIATTGRRCDATIAATSGNDRGRMSGTMKLTAAAEGYFADLRRVRASGGATKERSLYGPLDDLLTAVGATLRPKVFCVQELADQGAGHPDFGLYAARQVQKGTPREGQAPERGVVEVKSPGDDAWLTSSSWPPLQRARRGPAVDAAGRRPGAVTSLDEIDAPGASSPRRRRAAPRRSPTALRDDLPSGWR